MERDEVVTQFGYYVDEAQSQEVFVTASRVAPRYGRYRDRAAHRKIAVYVLEAAKT